MEMALSVERESHIKRERREKGETDGGTRKGEGISVERNGRNCPTANAISRPHPNPQGFARVQPPARLGGGRQAEADTAQAAEEQAEGAYQPEQEQGMGSSNVKCLMRI